VTSLHPGNLVTGTHSTTFLWPTVVKRPDGKFDTGLEQPSKSARGMVAIVLAVAELPWHDPADGSLTIQVVYVLAPVGMGWTTETSLYTEVTPGPPDLGNF
jgi:hypothetical protein